jgi:hypothetical protein
MSDSVITRMLPDEIEDCGDDEFEGDGTPSSNCLAQVAAVYAIFEKIERQIELGSPPDRKQLQEWSADLLHAHSGLDIHVPMLDLFGQAETAGRRLS